MLQQTRVETVIPYWQRFLALFPDVHALATADSDDVLGAWAGLGYYSRARNLQAAARQIEELHGGKLPDDTEALQALPGIGRYTAGAVASIAFDRPEPVLDGNVKRVLTRLLGIREDISGNSGPGTASGRPQPGVDGIGCDDLHGAHAPLCRLSGFAILRRKGGGRREIPSHQSAKESGPQSGGCRRSRRSARPGAGRTPTFPRTSRGVVGSARRRPRSRRSAARGPHTRVARANRPRDHAGLRNGNRRTRLHTPKIDTPRLPSQHIDESNPTRRLCGSQMACPWRNLLPAPRHHDRQSPRPAHASNGQICGLTALRRSSKLSGSDH